MGRKISASLLGADFADSPPERERLDGEDRDAKRFGEPDEFALAMGRRGASGYFIWIFFRDIKMLQGFSKLEFPFWTARGVWPAGEGRLECAVCLHLHALAADARAPSRASVQRLKGPGPALSYKFATPSRHAQRRD
jgi:hypothetical protein